MRQRLERAGGADELGINELLLAFGVRKATPSARRGVENRLRVAGILVDPPLESANRHTRVRLELIEPPGDGDLRAAAEEALAEARALRGPQLAKAIREATGVELAEARGAVRTLERAGDIVTGREDGRKVYRLPAPDPEPDPEPERDPAPLAAAVADFTAALPRPSLSEARRWASNVLAVAGVLLVTEAIVTVLWKEPFTAIEASQSQDSLSSELRHASQAEALKQRQWRDIAAEQNRHTRLVRRLQYLAHSLNSSTAAKKALGRIAIHRIGIDVVFVQGTGGSSLDLC